MSRKRRPAIEYVSDIGALAFDLQMCADSDIEKALDFIWSVNPRLFELLTEQLTDAKNRAAKVKP